jgi:thiamine pyrophosphate-dependent acetolactate synthase large subunit-like protein
VIQIEESPERLALNNRLDAGLVGDLAVSLSAVTDAVRTRATAEFKAAAQRRNGALAELRAREKEPGRHVWKRAGTASRHRCRAWRPSCAAACRIMS